MGQCCGGSTDDSVVDISLPNTSVQRENPSANLKQPGKPNANPKQPRKPKAKSKPSKPDPPKGKAFTRLWKNILKKDGDEPGAVMKNIHTARKNLFTGLTALKTKKDLSPADFLVFEGATFVLAECNNQLIELLDKNPHRFFGSILISAAAFSLSHFFLDLIPWKHRGDLEPENKKTMFSAAGPTRKKGKSEKTNSRKSAASLSDACSEVSDVMLNSTVYKDNTVYDNRKRDEMPSWLTTRQEALLERHGYENFKPTKNRNKTVTKLMNLSFCTKRLGVDAAISVNTVLTNKDAIRKPLLKLKEQPVTPVKNQEPDDSTESKRGIRFADDQNRDDFPNLIQRIFDLLEHFLTRTSDRNEVFDWQNLERQIKIFLEDQDDTKKIWTQEVVAEELIDLFPARNFMEIHFEIDDDLTKWLSGEEDWYQVQLKTGAPMDLENHSNADLMNSDERLRVLLRKIYQSRLV